MLSLLFYWLSFSICRLWRISSFLSFSSLKCSTFFSFSLILFLEDSSWLSCTSLENGLSSDAIPSCWESQAEQHCQSSKYPSPLFLKSIVVSNRTFWPLWSQQDIDNLDKWFLTWDINDDLGRIFIVFLLSYFFDIFRSVSLLILRGRDLWFRIVHYFAVII